MHSFTGTLKTAHLPSSFHNRSASRWTYKRRCFMTWIDLYASLEFWINRSIPNALFTLHRPIDAFQIVYLTIAERLDRCFIWISNDSRMRFWIRLRVRKYGVCNRVLFRASWINNYRPICLISSGEPNYTHSQLRTQWTHFFCLNLFLWTNSERRGGTWWRFSQATY